MNSKRQTVWLVSMLSLMVVLSAYYLFSNNVDDLQLTSEEKGMAQMDAWEVDSEFTGEGLDELVSDHYLTEEDEHILQQVEGQSHLGADFFVAQKIKRNEEMAQQEELLMTIITDSEQSTTALAQAYEDLDKIAEKQMKISTIEDQLAQQYENAIVSEQSKQWKVLIQSDKLEKSEAVSIIDLVIGEMDIAPNQIVVQYTP